MDEFQNGRLYFSGNGVFPRMKWNPSIKLALVCRAFYSCVLCVCVPAALHFAWLSAKRMDSGTRQKKSQKYAWASSLAWNCADKNRAHFGCITITYGERNVYGAVDSFNCIFMRNGGHPPHLPSSVPNTDQSNWNCTIARCLSKDS